MKIHFQTIITLAVLTCSGCDFSPSNSDSILIRSVFSQYASEGAFTATGFISEEGSVRGDLIQLDEFESKTLEGWRAMECPRGALVLRIEASIERIALTWSATGTYTVEKATGIFEQIEEEGTFKAHLDEVGLEQHEEFSGTLQSVP